MKRFVQCCAALLASLTLAGCLEVDQHPPYLHGEYAGKEDNRQQQVMFHSDKLSWSATILNRNMLQNEYNRANP
jgi:hypothetical protein